MTHYYQLEPEVPGELGPGSDVDRSAAPWVIRRVEFAFHDWLGDDLITSDPIFLVTAAMADKLDESGLTGFELREAAITRASEGLDMIEDFESYPAFRWLDVVGRATVDDFGLDLEGALVVSGSALEVLETGRLDQCDKTPLSP
ncbi:hypothetical protein JOD54_002137 [Actinokineospora baliensis]|uniref:hypothetical protein n=1 Tax=Actinokineospora baliensis TaxID=547056 RepID=UPI0019592E90|nr:hypothetical protein [Actinokineospora baliensis]MBM7771933.1 hypothetical protein [Actinokineospora baliensis]